MARLLKKVVAYARALGELEYRQSLNEGELKQIGANLIEGTEYSTSLRKKASRITETPAQAVRHREYRASLREHSKRFSRTRFLLQEENETRGKLRSEIQMILAETIRSARKQRA